MPAAPACAQTFDAAAVEAWARAVLRRSGLRADDADVVARSLVFADRRGVHTHGVARIPLYVLRLARGGIVAAARPEVVVSTGALTVVDGRGAAGAVTATLGVQQASAGAQRHGAAITLVRGGNDFGAAGYYASLLADAGLVGLAACNTDAVMGAPGSATAVLGTNPLAVAVPGTSLLLDMATSAAAHGKIAHAAAEGRAVPEGWGLDAAGRPTTDPGRILDGGVLQPAAGPKGFGLAFMIDVLAALAGAHTSPFIASVDGDPARPQDLGMVFLAISTAWSTEPSAFQASVANLVRAVHATATAAGQPAMVPGEPEEARRAQLGPQIRLPGPTLAELLEVARQTALPFPAAADPAPGDSQEEVS